MPKVMYAIYSTVSKKDVFGILEPTKNRARKKLLEKIGKDAFKYRFEVRKRKIRSDHMLDQAKKKLNDEMAKANNSYVSVVGQFLLNHIASKPNDAEKILQDGKTISGSLSAMRSAAEKKKVNGVGVLTDQEGFNLVLAYYGIQGQATAPTLTPVASAPVETDLVFNVTIGG